MSDYEKPYDYNSHEIKLLKGVDPKVALMIEGYALACADIMYKLTGESPCAKTYDPMRIEGVIAYSYAFNLKDGGRHHDLRDYKDVGEILGYILQETVDWIITEEGFSND